MKQELQKADFGGGCFWSVEEVFRTTTGVVKTTVGYEGGHVDNPTFGLVTSHTTGHAETVQVEFDHTKVSFAQLLNLFFDHHDPTQVNRQGADLGDNYRSVIFYHNEDQKRQADAKIEELNKTGRFKNPIATQVVAAKTFWHAEEYHQQYLHKRDLGVCY